MFRIVTVVSLVAGIVMVTASLRHPKPPEITCTKTRCRGKSVCRIVKSLYKTTGPKCIHADEVPKNGGPEVCGATGHPLLEVRKKRSKSGRLRGSELKLFESKRGCPAPDLVPINGVCCADVGICYKPKDPGPCRAAIPRYYYDAEHRKCHHFTYGGCEGNENNFETLQECQETCEDICELSQDPGPCYAAFPRYYYDSGQKACREFTYGGCEGNANNFHSLQDCQTACDDVCKLSKDPGPCFGLFPRYYYDTAKGECREFIYGGCEGNANNFPSLQECQVACDDICKLPKDPGPCFGSFPRYYYDADEGKCLEFIYGGCQGNANNFQSLQECQDACDDICTLKRDPGPCEALIPRYYYDMDRNKCLNFTYGGCEGNANNFKSLKECQRKCVERTAGQCPTPGPDTIGICAFTCEEDNNCDRGKKCCSTACGGTTCTSPVPPNTCDNVRCAKGKECREVFDGKQVSPQCLEDPPETPRDDECVLGLPLLVRTRKGVAVANCGKDPNRIDCPAGYSCQIETEVDFFLCCRNQETECFPPCKPDEICEKTVINCLVPPCPPTPRCVASTEKPGECPEATDFGTCAFECEDDQDCKGDRKCCKTGCSGTTCAIPLPPKLTCANVLCSVGTTCVENNGGPKCVPIDICHLPRDPGPCKARIPRFYYDSSRRHCRRFYYGGCKGNANRFSSKGECQKACKKV